MKTKRSTAQQASHVSQQGDGRGRSKRKDRQPESKGPPVSEAYRYLQGQFLMLASTPGIRLKVKSDLRLISMIVACECVQSASRQEMQYLFENPNRDIVLICAAMLKGRFTPCEIAMIYDGLYDCGRLLKYDEGGFDWSTNPHELPIHFYVSILGQCLRTIDIKENPVWQFAMEGLDKVVFKTLMESAKEAGLDFNLVCKYFAAMKYPVESWQASTLYEMQEVQQRKGSNQFDLCAAILPLPEEIAASTIFGCLKGQRRRS